MTKISQLSSIGDSLAVGDQFLIRDIDDTGSPNKSVTVSGITRALDVGTAAAPAIAFATDKNTGIYSPGADQLAVATNGVERVEFGTSEVVFNDGNNDYDFRVESDNNASLLFVDASTDRFGIGHSSPATLIHVADTLAGSPVIARIENFSASANSDAALDLKTPNETYTLKAVRSSARFDFEIAGTPKLSITSAGLVGIGTSSPVNLIQIRKDASASVPSAGASGHHFAAGDTAFGLAAGALSSGNAYLQATRWDGTAANYNLLLQPNGGSVGIGTTSPTRQLDVRSTAFFDSNGDGTGTSPSIAIGSTSVGLSYVGGGHLSFTTGSAEKARIDSSGRVGIGTTGPTQALSVVGNILSGGAGTNYVASSSNGVTSSYLITDASGSNLQVDGAWPIRFTTNSSERARIDSSGRLLVGTSTSVKGGASNKTVIEDNFAAQYGLALVTTQTSGAGNFAQFVYNGSINGSISSDGTTTTYATTSDYRLKENIVAVTDSIARLQQLKPSRFNFIADPGKEVDGFIAHEAQSVVPECVTGTKDEVDADGNPKYQGIDQSKLVPLLTAALQEAIGEIESLKARLTAAGI